MTAHLFTRTRIALVLDRSRPSTAPYLRVSMVDCAQLADAPPQALGITYWFDADREGEPRPAAVRFTGHRSGVVAGPGPTDTFTVTETIKAVPPGCGRVAITSRIVDVAPGEWTVTAVRDDPAPSNQGAGQRDASGLGSTGFSPLIGVRAPGVHLGAWPLFVGTGGTVALVLQSRLAAQSHLPVRPIFTVSVIACVAGLLGARIYHVAQHDLRRVASPRAWIRAGMCIQGFVIAALVTATIGAIAEGISVPHLLDLTAPALLIGMAIGRLGCFFGGCCAGRPTASRWGLWSSDRRIGISRIPTQLLESALCLGIGAAALAARHSTVASIPGAVFIGAIAVYTLGRQMLLPLRDLPRATSYGRPVAIAVTATVVLAVLLVAIFT
jgi:phosphatidylglycerol:prolipoprotein diacylglycerol transferase